MNSLISRSTVPVAVAIASLLAAPPARAQSDERAVVAVVSGAASVPVAGRAGPGAPFLAASSLSLNARAQHERG